MDQTTESITVILNCYKRPEYLAEQLKAIKAQTKQPVKVWLWMNACKENKKFNPYQLDFDRVFKSNVNCKYHARFAIGLLADTDYVAFFDDDTIPADMWFENCLNTMADTPGILGGAGCILENREYVYHERVGWPSRNAETTEVDLVGHAWFMKREHLSYMWRETPYTLENGEDIQLGALAKIHGGVKCYCPPHPIEKPRWTSSLRAEEYGNDSKASSNGSLMPIPDFYKQRDECISHYVDNGWDTVRGVK